MGGARRGPPNRRGGPYQTKEISPSFDLDDVEELSELLEQLLDQLHTRLHPASKPNAGTDLPEGGTLNRDAVPSLPSSRILRRLIRQRRRRSDYLPADLFSEPAWDMLLDLAAMDVEGRQVSVTSLCLASGVPISTALRWIAALEAHGIITRVHDQADRRRVFVHLTGFARRALARYFADSRMRDGQL